MDASLTQLAGILDSVAPSGSLGALCGQLYSNPPVHSLGAVQHRLHHPQAKQQRFFAYNTFLMDLPGRGRKPAVEYRDAEIGRYTAQHHDIVCLSEVWHHEERSDLMDQWPGDAHMAHKSGRRGLTNAVPMRKSAGLVTISRDLEILTTQFHAYQNESGSDAHANKGCLLTVHDTGLGQGARPSCLNVYSTHLNASGDAKYPQVLELADFIVSKMNLVKGDSGVPPEPGLNGNIVAGDFNLDRLGSDQWDMDALATQEEARRLPQHVREAINHRVGNDGLVTRDRAARKSGYQLLRDVMSALGFQSLWERRNGTPGYTSDLTRAGVINSIARTDPSNPDYCDDNHTLSPGVSASAIDHVFVSATTEQMDFSMDFTRPRRPHTERPAGARDRSDISFMSDHLGIATTILLAPR